MKFSLSTRKAAETRRVSLPVRPEKPLRLTRTFVLTGDERCPIAGLWTSVADSALADAEAELCRPVRRRRILPGQRLPGRAFFPRHTGAAFPQSCAAFPQICRPVTQPAPPGCDSSLENAFAT